MLKDTVTQPVSRIRTVITQTLLSIYESVINNEKQIHYYITICK